MIYDSLRKLPKVIQVEILDTGDVSLLSDEETPIEELIDLWSKLSEDFNTRFNGKNHKKTFDVYKELNFLANKYEIINNAVESLRFDKDENLINMLLEYGYRLCNEKYLEDLEKIEKETEGIIHKINNLKNQLPKQKEEFENNNQVDILISNMAAQTSILGYDFDFYSISVEKYHAMQPIVESKIKAIESQNNANKRKK
jgi:hypothetical protein